MAGKVIIEPPTMSGIWRVSLLHFTYDVPNGDLLRSTQKHRARATVYGDCTAVPCARWPLDQGRMMSGPGMEITIIRVGLVGVDLIHDGQYCTVLRSFNVL